jgi:hypothetical protein
MNVHLLFPSYNRVEHKNLRGFPGGHILLNFKTEDFFSFRASCCQGTVEGDEFVQHASHYRMALKFFFFSKSHQDKQCC